MAAAGWFSKLSKAQQAAYLKSHPNSKYHGKSKSKSSTTKTKSKSSSSTKPTKKPRKGYVWKQYPNGRWFQYISEKTRHERAVRKRLQRKASRGRIKLTTEGGGTVSAPR